MILSINSKKPVWWVAMILVASFYDKNILLINVNLVALDRNPFGPMRWWKR